MQLHFKEYGSGFPLIILHGLFGSLENWQTISEGLAGQFHVFALDQRNHGRSPHDAEMNYTAMAEDVREFMERHSLNRAHVLGHSMGGKAAMQFALLFPGQVAKLLVADMASRAYEPAHNYIFDALLALDLKSFSNRQQVEAALEPAISDWSVRRFLLKNLARDETGAFRWRINLRALHTHYSRLNEALESGEVFAGPALFLQGEKSDYVREEDWPGIRQLFPRAEIRTLAGAGHWLHAEAPAEFIAIATEFLNRAEENAQ